MTASAADPSESSTPETLDLLCQLVATVYRSPGEPLRADLASGALAGALARLSEDIGVSAPALTEPEWTVLQTTYVDLFVSSPRGIAAPPYVGFAMDGELLGPSVDALKAFFSHHGIEFAADWADLPDHLAAVAEAGHLLAEAGRAPAARAVLARFLYPWFQRYAEAVVATDDSGFYGPLTQFLRAAIGEVTCEAAT